MMEKRNIIKEMRSYASKMPRTINEAINYGSDSDMDGEFYDEEEMEQAAPKQEQPEEGKMDVKAFIDDIRKKSLKGMAQLADTPEDPLYEILKRIWQTCDKAYSDQKQANAPQKPQMYQNGNGADFNL